jgi:hypothetical protein
MFPFYTLTLDLRFPGLVHIAPVLAERFALHTFGNGRLQECKGLLDFLAAALQPDKVGNFLVGGIGTDFLHGRY